MEIKLNKFDLKKNISLNSHNVIIIFNLAF